MIEEGKNAPLFTLPDQNGEEFALRCFRGSPVVLYFYPKDDTSGCTDEACQFRELFPKFEQSSAVILGVSPDSVESHRKFADKHKLPFTLLADEPGKDGVPKVAGKYGVWQEKSMYGRTYMGVARTTYLIGPDGKVARRWDKVKVPGHAEAVLEEIRSRFA